MHAEFLSAKENNVKKAARQLRETPPIILLCEPNELPTGWKSAQIQHDGGNNTDSENDTTSVVGPSSSIADEEMKPSRRRYVRKNPEAPLNLQCMESIKAHYPKNYFMLQKLQPLDSFRVSPEQFQKWINLPKEEQHKLKSDYNALAPEAKLKFKNQIPGLPVKGCGCIGCTGRKPRKDKDTPKTKTKTRKRKSIEDSSKPSAEYVSMGHDAESRSDVITSNAKKRKWRRNTGKDLYSPADHAKNIQQQGDETAMAYIHKAIAAFAKACTLATKENIDLSNTSIPRVRGLMVWEIEVSETPMSGGQLPTSALRRETPLIYRCSSDKVSYAELMNTLTAPTQAFKKNCEVVDFFGTGENVTSKLTKHMEARKTNRLKRVKVSTTMSDIVDKTTDSLVHRHIVDE
jgi:hypothetical protein